MAKRPKTKTEILSVRVSPKIKYGIALIARKQRRNLSDMVNVAIESYLESEGIAAKRPDKLNRSLLDSLWSESEIGRVMALTTFAPELATSEELEIDRLCDIFLPITWEDYVKKHESRWPDLINEKDYVYNCLFSTSEGLDLIRRVIAKDLTIEQAIDKVIRENVFTGF